MSIWKGNQLLNRVMMCPKCHGKNLRYANNGGLIFSNPQLICPDCGYNGRVYIDIDPDDQQEKQIEQMILEDNPDFLDTRKSNSELACLSLEHKWHPNQSENHNTLRDWCPYCEDVHVICHICQCPLEVCKKHATEGWIGELNKRYNDDTELCDVDPDLYQKIVKKFQSLCVSSNKQS